MRERLYHNLERCLDSVGGVRQFNQIVAINDDNSTKMTQDGMSVARSPKPRNPGDFFGVNSKPKNAIEYSDGSMEDLIDNNTLRYEKNKKAVIDEYFEMSRKSFKLLKKKI